MNENERTARRYLEEKGLRVFRNGAPDFFATNAEGKLMAFEVKSRTDKLTRSQRALRAVLRGAGISYEVLRVVDGHISTYNPGERHVSEVPRWSDAKPVAGASYCIVCRKRWDKEWCEATLHRHLRHWAKAMGHPFWKRARSMGPAFYEGLLEAERREVWDPNVPGKAAELLPGFFARHHLAMEQELRRRARDTGPPAPGAASASPSPDSGSSTAGSPLPAGGGRAGGPSAGPPPPPHEAR